MQKIIINRKENIFNLGFIIIKGYEDYAINKDGVIISLKYNNKSNNYYVLSNCIDNTGYVRVKLCKNGYRKSLLLHRLLAQTFIPNPNPKELNEVNHKDYNTLNNSIDNLEWCNRLYNTQYSKGHHSYSNPNKVKVKRINTINNTFDIFESLIDACKKCHVAFNTIYKSIRDKNYIINNKYRFEYV